MNRRSSDCASLRDFGRARRWVTCAAAGRRVRILNDEYEVVAYIVPATEAITPRLIDWFMTRLPAEPDEERLHWRIALLRMARQGWRYSRVQNLFFSPDADGP